MPVGSVLVTGAAGFIGRSVIRQLQRRGVDTIATDVRAHPEVPELVVGDLLDQDFVHGLVRRRTIDAVIHLAGMLPTAARRDPLAATRINIDASCLLLKESRDGGIGRFVFGSSLGVYGGRFDITPVSEETPAAPEELYGAGKMYVEYAGIQLQTESFAFSALRIATTVGEGVSHSASPWRSQIFEVLAAKTPATVEVPYVREARLPLVHVDDVAAALAEMATAGQALRGVFNSHAETFSVAELSDTVTGVNSAVTIEAGTRRETGIPAYLNCQKLLAAISYRAAPLRQHFEAAAG